MKSALRSIRRNVLAAIFCATMLASQLGTAADGTYSIYLDCQGDLEVVDQIVKTKMAPVYDAAVEEGLISRWGWGAHHTGGAMDRFIFITAESPLAAVKAQEALYARTNGEEWTEANAQWREVCSDHVDYVWEAVDSNGAGVAKVWLSGYHVCNTSSEEQLDALHKNTMAPILNKLVEQGSLQSWSWHAHSIGGQYRRLGTMAAKDIDALLTASNQFYDELAKIEESAKYGDFCSSHQDYIWMDGLSD